MAFGEQQLRETGDPRDSAFADVLAGILAARGADIPLPSQEQPLEAATNPTRDLELGTTAVSANTLVVNEATLVQSPATEAEIRGDLSFEINQITEPLFNIAHSMLPLVKDNPTNMWGKVRKTATEERYGQQMRNGRLLTYTYKTTYTPSTVGNTPESMQVDLSPYREPHEEGLTLTTKFANGAASRILLRYGKESRGRGYDIDIEKQLAYLLMSDISAGTSFADLDLVQVGNVINIQLTPFDLAFRVRHEYPNRGFTLPFGTAIDTYFLEADGKTFKGSRQMAHTTTLPAFDVQSFKDLLDTIVGLVPDPRAFEEAALKQIR